MFKVASIAEFKLQNVYLWVCYNISRNNNFIGQRVKYVPILVTIFIFFLVI